MDDFKRNIKGYRRNSATCPCCREVNCKATSRRLARRRLRQADRREVGRPDPLDALIAAIKALDEDDDAG